VSTPEFAMRGARWSELLFGLIALLLARGLPVAPPGARTTFLLVNWYGMAVVALWLVVALRRPSRSSWAAAVALGVYFFANALFGLVAWRAGAPGAEPAGPAFVLSPVLIVLATLAQISVGIRCWQARAIRTRRDDAKPETPGA
jgi:hypothetical protein